MPENGGWMDFKRLYRIKRVQKKKKKEINKNK